MELITFVFIELSYYEKIEKNINSHTQKERSVLVVNERVRFTA